MEGFRWKENKAAIQTKNCKYGFWLFDSILLKLNVSWSHPVHATCYSDILRLLLQKSKKEATNFDAEFTKEDPVLTPINQDIVKTINQVKI